MPSVSSALLCAVTLGGAARVHTSPSSSAMAPPPTIIHLVADDLGYHDTNWRNHQVSTDALDALVKVGVEIPDFYVYKMCAPSRGSVMSGRYPWHVGYYDNNGGGGPPLGFKFLPELIAPTYDSHALGKVCCGRTAVALSTAATLALC